MKNECFVLVSVVDEAPVAESETREEENVEGLLNNVSGNVVRGKLFS